MSSLINYYLDHPKVNTSHDIRHRQRLTVPDGKHYYTTDNPSGWYFDLSAKPVGNRPVYRKYHVGSQTCLKDNHRAPQGKYNCKQPFFGPECL